MEKWKNIRYSLDKKTNLIDEDEIGSFTQFPLRLAWAITIHKSQGLTFEKAIIDAGEAFASGASVCGTKPLHYFARHYIA